jgi:hypothetical protein
LDEFINQYMRNNNIWLTVAHQSINQIDKQLLNTLLSLGTYIFGRAAQMEEARVLADVLYTSDPYQVKHERVITHTPVTSRFGRVEPRPQTQSEPVFMPIPEQKELFAQQIRNLGLFQFLFRPAESEGQISTKVYPINIRTVDLDKETGKYIFPDNNVLQQLRAKLAAKYGMPITSLIKEQEARLAQAVPTEAAGHDTPQLGQTPNQHRRVNPQGEGQNTSMGGHPKRHRERVG